MHNDVANNYHRVINLGEKWDTVTYYAHLHSSDYQFLNAESKVAEEQKDLVTKTHE